MKILIDLISLADHFLEIEWYAGFLDTTIEDFIEKSAV